MASHAAQDRARQVEAGQMTAALLGAGLRPTGRAPSRAMPVRAWLVRVVLIVAVGLLVKEPELLLPIGPDQGTYSYVAERILDGGLPYVDAWDNKPPATYYVHAAALALVPRASHWDGTCIPGTNQPCGYVALQALDVVWTIATTLSALAVARALGFEPLAATSSALLFAVFANLSQLSKEGPTPEKQLLLPMTLAYLAVLRGRPGLAGLAAGVALLFKQTAVSIPLALLAWWLLERQSVQVRWLGRFGVGYVVPLVLVMGFFAWRGGLSALWDATFAYNLAQAGTSALRVPYGLLAGSWHVFSNSSALLWLLGLGGALLAWSGDGRLPGERGGPWRLLVCWAAADALSLCLGGAKFAQVYYVQLVPSLALLGGLAVACGWRWLGGMPLARAYAGLVGVAVFLLSNQFQASVALRAWNERTPGRSSVPLEASLGQRLGPGERGGRSEPLFVWGDNTEIYLYADGRSPGRFFHVFPVSGVYATRGMADRRAELLRAWQAAPPAIIAIDPATLRDDPDGSLGLNPSSFPELRRLLEAEYTPLAGIGGGWQAFRRR